LAAVLIDSMSARQLSVREREFELPGFKLAAREWGEPTGSPVLALHGWLDNAGSFDKLAPLLAGCHVIALDSAGHGLSGSRSADSSYNIWQDVGDVIDVADALGWAQFNLLGHSRGGAIAALLAGTFPERARRLVLIEGGIPMVGQAENAAEDLARALTESRQLRAKAGRVFVARDLAIAERAEGFSKVSLEAAEILARRSLRTVPGGYQWHADQRLKATSEMRLTAEHVRSFLRRITAPALMFLAAESPIAHRSPFVDLLPAFPDLKIERLPGGHHLHLEGAETRIAAAAREFFR
jgi:pimeloyl-ACP methyl ester carboxylesterase